MRPEFQIDAGIVRCLLKEIEALSERINRPVRLMEVCGTHTMAIYRAGLPALLPKNIQLLSGPGCPVCVTPMGYLDAAIALARDERVVLATFGDMMRVPGSTTSLERERAAGADVRVIYSPLDALELARRNAGRKVIFLAVGFETTAPTTAVTLAEAKRDKIGNFFLLSAHKVVPPALKALLAVGNQDTKHPALPELDGFILPGHVSAIVGSQPYEFIARQFGLPGVITGFEPSDVLESVLLLLKQIAAKRPSIVNQYSRVVRPEGNRAAQERMERCFQVTDSEWRGIGLLPDSGLMIAPEFAEHDAATAFRIEVPRAQEPAGCRCGEVLRGRMQPESCPLFANRCTPASPVGACMVSSEGTCAAYFRYGRN